MFVNTMRAYSFIMLITALTLGLAISITTPSTAHARPPLKETPRLGLLKPGDKINVLVEGEKKLSGFYTINKAGTITMPLIGNVFVAGKTVHEAMQTIVNQLKDGYLKHPDVTIPEPKTRKAKSAKNIPTPPKKTLRHHYKKMVKNRTHIRPIPALEIKPVPVQKIKSTKHIYVIGAVKEPGYYALPQQAGHLLNAIAIAGGYTEKANEENFELVRDIKGAYYRKHAPIGALKYNDGDIIIIGER